MTAQQIRAFGTQVVPLPDDLAEGTASAAGLAGQAGGPSGTLQPNVPGNIQDRERIAHRHIDMLASHSQSANLVWQFAQSDDTWPRGIRNVEDPHPLVFLNDKRMIT